MKNKLIITLLVLFCASAFSLAYLKQQQKSKKKPVTLVAGSYSQYWNTVDSLQKKGLNKSALDVVMKIYNRSKNENNPEQLVKAVIHRMKFTSYTEEDAVKKMISDLTKDCSEAKFPANSILHSMLAETYWNFYQQNRGKFIGRSETVNFKGDDINTWDLKKILEQTVNEYRLSLDLPDNEMKVQLNVFDEVLVKGSTDETRKFRPTLYDFLAHRAVDFFMNEEPGLTESVNKYKIDAAWYLNDVDMFLNFFLPKDDTLNLKYNAIKILQDLIRFHQNDAHPGALLDVNLKRLKFVHNELTIANKDSLYLQILQQMANQYKDFPGSADALYEIASIYFNKGNAWKSTDGDVIRLMKRKAELVCDTAIARFPYSQGGLNCKHLKAVINEKFISFQTEKVNVPDQPFLGKVNYGNINKVFMRIVAADKEGDEETTGLYGERLVKYYLGLNAVKEWSVSLPEDGDKQNHSAELSLPELPLGKYVILVSTSPTFSYSKNAVAYSIAWISNTSYINRRVDGSYDIYVMNRSTGEPMQDVQATLYFSQYDYKSRKYELKKGKTFTTNSDGYINVTGEENQRNFDLEMVKGNDRLFLKDNFYLYRSDVQKHSSTVTHFFTDRAIYRPGQTIYFKGIVLETDGENSHIKAGIETRVALYDANSQKISEDVFTTNEYGTFNGTFTAPQGVLTGMMRIQNENGSRYFSVEEYKRPMFEVTFEPLLGSFLLNDRVTVIAKAQTYSGAKVSDAKVTYHVTRRAHIPPWYSYWRGFMPPSQQTEIANGTTVTDADGITHITFDAVPDLSVPKESDPIFNFEISTDVTDVNGETHSGLQNISVSYTALFVETDLKNEINRDELKSFVIQSRNMAGNFEPAEGKISISRLEQPARLLRDRLWDAPDKHTMARGDFEKQFPHDVFENENEPGRWKKAEEVFGRDFDTKKDSVVKLSDLKNLKQGNYLLEIKSKDKYSHDVKYLHYFIVYSPKEKECSVNSFAWFTSVKIKGEPGEKAQFLVGTHGKNVKLLYEIEQKSKITSKQWIALNDEQKLIEIPIEESNRGNFTVHFNFVKQSRFYKIDQLVTVPWSNKDIDFSFETFRDKLLPGAKEEWRLKLHGKFSDKIAAEMMVSMYDASLDAFAPNKWDFSVWNPNFSTLSFQSGTGFTSVSSANFAKDWNEVPPVNFRTYDELNWFGYSPGGGYYRDEMMMTNEGMQAAESRAPILKKESEDKDESKAGDKIETVADSTVTKEKNHSVQVTIQTRTNFSETAFFYPSLVTNEKNEIVFSFTLPDALTRWKFMGLAHTKELESGTLEKEIVTQKELMVVPNAPRFLREGDTITFPSKITNLSDTSMSGTAVLSFYDPLTNGNITSKILKADSSFAFSIIKGGNTNVNWSLIIPEGISAIKYRVTAKSGRFTDGEEQVIPVLTNRMLVTESFPLAVNSKQTKTFSFDKFRNNISSTLQNHKLTLEFTSNPAWYAIQALPYLMEYPYECSEQIFSRYYSNAIASHIVNSNPKIKAVFESWKTQSPESFLSNLEKNQELKSAMLEQTPWVMDAKDESERKKRVALLFDLNKMSNELQSALFKLKKKQNPDGSWPWFDGMPDDRYITQYIVEGFGHLDHLGVKSVRENETTWDMVKQAVQYLDRRMDEDYQNLLSMKVDLTKNNLSDIQIHYLYARSFFKNIQVEGAFRKAFDYYLSQTKKYWLENNEYMQAMISLSLFRNDEKIVASGVIKSLKENSQYNEELGRYWKNNSGGYHWAMASIETQSLLIEAFHDVANDQQTVDEMQRWLLKNKQTNDWKTTKATAEACYALLLQGTDFLSQSSPTEITIGKEKINPSSNPELKVEAGTGYFKTSWTGSDIKPEMGEVKVINKNDAPAWGALYWQYFERLDKITAHETPLKLEKKTFLEQNSSSGKIIVPVTESSQIKVGDRIKVRIELRVDRDMEYVVMKDMRASGLEPENVFSSYKWQDGLGYYESTHDASTDFFFSYLPKGTYIFEYPLRASQQGNFSNGITNVQCVYAPEFSAHSEGLRMMIGQ